MVDDTDPKVESDLRRRAAWLLGMLVTVALLFVIVISAIVKTGDKNSNSGPGPLDLAATGSIVTPSPTPNRSEHPSSPHPTTQHPTTQHPTSHPATHHTHPSKPKRRKTVTTSCPGAHACVLRGDVGNTIGWINVYRTTHGLRAVHGWVSPRAQRCALRNGGGCAGGWAETFLGAPNGRLAVRKILPFGHLSDPRIRFVGVGWAYSPAARTYYYAIVRHR